MTEALRALIDDVVLAFGSLVYTVQDPQALKDLLADLGWTVKSVPQPLLDLAAAGSGLIDAIESDPGAASAAELIDSVKRLADTISAISTRSDADFPSEVDVASFKATIGRDLIDYFLVEHLLRNRYRIGDVLRLAGLIRLVRAPAVGLRQPYLRRQVMWDRIAELITDPAGGFREAFEWNALAPRLAQAVSDLASLLESYNLELVYFRPIGDQLAFVNAGATQPFADPVGIDLAFAGSEDAPDGTGAGIQLLLRPPTSARGAAISLLPYARLTGGQEIALSQSTSLSVHGDADFAKGVGLTLAPGHPAEVQAGFLGGTAVSPAEARIELKVAAPADEPEKLLVGTAGASRLSIHSIRLAGGARVVSAGTLDAFVALDLDNARIVIKPDPGEADSFLAGFLGADGISGQLSLGLQLSSRTGFHWTGSGGLEASFPVCIELGPISVSAFSVGLKPAERNVGLDVGATVSGKIGPVTVVIDGVGFTLAAAFPDPPTGNLGPLDVSFGFLPPSGAGLSIDAAGVSGGGFVRHDDATAVYSGVLQLEFTDLALQAFGLISTQTGDGAGYSLLALVDADFPPVQLGWGFTLDGVGGLLAVHRTASVDALRAALKADQLGTVLFPKNAITDAPRILAQLAAMFPAAPGQFLFGPMALIGWGTPTVLTAAIAVILELPEPVRLLLLARVVVRAPSELVPLVHINMDALGVLDLSGSELSLDAALFDSTLAGYTLSGEMSLRATWAAQREFLLAIGGFHPRFQAPAGFPPLRRITIDMPGGVVSKLRLTAYLAITSNSVQLGADLDVFVGAAGFGLSGNLGFDALLQFHPFHFEADISGKVAITFAGEDLASVSLDATLTGPAPWNIAGHFKIHVVFFDVHKSFSASWGEDAPDQAAASVDVGQLLSATLADPRSWAARLPDGVPALAGVRRIEDPGRLLAHPLARLEVHERIVPLDLDINRFGEAAPSGARRFAITGLRVGGTAVASEAVLDDFAPAQFFALSEEEKLERPSFERHDAGVITSGSLVTSGRPPVAKTIAYETLFIDAPGGAPRTEPGTQPQPLPLTDIAGILEIGSAARAGIARTARRRYSAPGNPARVAEPLFALADAGTLASAGIGPAAGATFSEVQAMLDGEIARAPGQRDALLIVATHEMAAG